MAHMARISGIAPPFRAATGRKAAAPLAWRSVPRLVGVVITFRPETTRAERTRSARPGRSEKCGKLTFLVGGSSTSWMSDDRFDSETGRSEADDRQAVEATHGYSGHRTGKDTGSGLGSSYQGPSGGNGRGTRERTCPHGSRRSLSSPRRTVV